MKNSQDIAGDGAYVQKSSVGVYVSMTSEFNPEGREIAAIEAQERAARIGAMLGVAVP
jgi:hypothetical protein